MNAAATTTQQPTRCRRCKRPLRNTTPDGFGPTCRRRIRAAAKAKVIAQHKPTTVAKAQELIEQGGIVPVRGLRVFQVVASNGTSTYKTAAQACTCPAGIKGHYVCYHRVAAQLVTAA